MQSPRPTPPDAAAIEAIILALVTARGPNASICPSEAARALMPASTNAPDHTLDRAPDQSPGANQAKWQSLMTPVRQVAMRLARAGQIDILRKGRPVPLAEAGSDDARPADIKGVIRLRIRGVQ